MSRYQVIGALGVALALVVTADGAAGKKPAAGPYVANVEARVLENDAFRRVLHTGERTQIVAMQLPVNSDIGEEKHDHVEQIIVVVRGSGRVESDGKSQPLGAGDLVAIPKGQKHNIVNVGSTPLELYTIYSPPNHLAGRVHLTKADAAKDKANEEFGHSVR